MVDIERPLLEFDLKKEIKVLEKEYENFNKNLDLIEWQFITDLRELDRILVLYRFNYIV